MRRCFDKKKWYFIREELCDLVFYFIIIILRVVKKNKKYIIMKADVRRVNVLPTINLVQVRNCVAPTHQRWSNLIIFPFFFVLFHFIVWQNIVYINNLHVRRSLGLANETFVVLVPCPLVYHAHRWGQVSRQVLGGVQRQFPPGEIKYILRRN